MPIYIDSFLKTKNEKEYAKTCARLVGDYFNKSGSRVSPDGVHFNSRCFVEDKSINGWVGQIVYTLKVVDGTLMLYDCDVVFSASKPVELMFEYKLPCSDEATEYYDAFLEETDHHFQIQTVNRYAVKGDIEGTKQKVYLSALPISFVVAKDMEKLNKELGFKPIEKDGHVIKGFAKDFMGSNMRDDSDMDPFSMICGKVKTVRDVAWKIGRKEFKFELITLETGAGIMPMAMNHEIFGKPKVKVGDYMFATAHVKADFWDGEKVLP